MENSKDTQSESLDQASLAHQSFPDLMTEEELIVFLRIPEVSDASDYSNVIRNLLRTRDLPRIAICNRNLYPKYAIMKWIKEETMPK